MLILLLIIACALITISACSRTVAAEPAADKELPGETSSGQLSPPEYHQPVQKRPGLLLSFTGDIMAHNVNFNMEDYSAIYAGVQDLFQNDDLSFANLEFPVYEDKPMSTFPMFNVHPPYVEAAINAGLDTFSMANNHSTDKGPDGVIATYSVMEQYGKNNGIAFSGIRKDPNLPYEPVLIEKNGWRIGFLAVTQWLNTYWGGDYAHYLHYQEEEDKQAFFRLLDETAETFDLFILSFHGGVEYATVPSKEKIQFFDECLDHGVDIVWAHHPHVLQPWFFDTQREGGKLIIYSAGNFISGQAWYMQAGKPDHPRTYTGDGAVFQVRIHDNNGTYRIHSVIPVALTNYKDPKHGMISRKLAEMPVDPDIPESWQKFYSRRKQVITSHIADYSNNNILP